MSEINKVVVKSKRVLIGRVISDRMMKTVTVLVERREKHSVYGKFITRSTKYHVHDESGRCVLGDMVEIVEGRPISKTKAWSISKVLEQTK